MDTVRDRLWMWGHEAGSHDEGWGITGTSRITPAEAVFYFDIPNLIMVRYAGKPAPPFYQYSIPFIPLKQVVWSLVGAGGETSKDERQHVLELAKHLPNMTGVFMDDFFRPNGTFDNVGVLSVEELIDLRTQLMLPDRTLALWVTFYADMLDLPVYQHLALCDKVTFWTMNGAELCNLEVNFRRFEELTPSCSRILGCYMWNYGQGRPLPVELMEMQCELGLQWLKEGRIEGIVFLASCICDLDFETVEWTRDWISHVGEQLLTY